VLHHDAAESGQEGQHSMTRDDKQMILNSSNSINKHRKTTVVLCPMQPMQHYTKEITTIVPRVIQIIALNC